MVPNIQYFSVLVLEGDGSCAEVVWTFLGISIPGWTLVGYMRYRSRRDLMKLTSDPRFQNGHAYKHAAISMTSSFPTRPQPIGFVGPRVWVALVLALAAAALSSIYRRSHKIAV